MVHCSRLDYCELGRRSWRTWLSRSGVVVSPKAVGAVLRHRARQPVRRVVIVGQRVVRNSQTVRQCEVHRRRRLAAAGRGDDDEVGLIECTRTLAVTVLDRVLDGPHAREAAISVAEAVIIAQLFGCRHTRVQ